MRRFFAAAALAMPLALVTSALLAPLEGCKPKVVRMETVRDALVSSDPAALEEALKNVPTCPDAPPVAVLPGKPSPLDKGCLSDIANTFGSRSGFQPMPPDHAALTTAAVLVARDGRADRIAHADAWLGVLKGGRGVGADALRAAVSRAMEHEAPTVGRPLRDEAAARAAMKAVAAAIPGACPTYYLLGRGDDVAKLPPELGPDHAACVQKDLARREGPGPSYGSGIPRALEGALALWREAERALRLGAPAAEPAVKQAVEARLGTIEPATLAIATERVATPIPQATLDRMGELHASAGIVLWRDAGAGDGGVDAGVPTGIPVAVPPAAPSLSAKPVTGRPAGSGR